MGFVRPHYYISVRFLTSTVGVKEDIKKRSVLNINSIFATLIPSTYSSGAT